MRFLRPGAGAPPWLEAVLASIERGLRQRWPLPFRLWQGETTALPAASEYGGGLAYDTLTARPVYSDGAAWLELQPYDATLAALAAYNSNGLLVQTAPDTFAGRTLIGPAAGFSISNGNGVAGNPTFALTNDLAALEALSGTNTLYYRSGTDAWSPVTIGGLLSFSGGTLNVGDPRLVAMAGLSPAADQLIYWTGPTTAAMTGLSGVARTLLAQSTQALMRSTGLGLGSAALKNTGTSGDAVPVLNGAATTWAAGATFGGTVVATGLRDSGTRAARFEGTGGGGYPTGATGKGVGAYISGGNALLEGYDITAAAYIALEFRASSHVFKVGGSAAGNIVLTIDASGNAVFSGGVFVSPSAGQGRAFGTAALGLNLTGGGSTYDVCAHAFNGTTAWGVRTGTANVDFLGNIDVNGEARCNTLRIDAAETVAAVVSDRWVAVNINGTVRKLLLAA
jgi:hypothetical protein